MRVLNPGRCRYQGVLHGVFEVANDQEVLYIIIEMSMSYMSCLGWTT
jgi:hypothetical protein